ncbi:hypothetical protein G9A89_016447 [Geosiphon pyriformis]|nr:hypothetical protein G9A89_016447 [Geosiphon pyriformis]
MAAWLLKCKTKEQKDGTHFKDKTIVCNLAIVKKTRPCTPTPTLLFNARKYAAASLITLAEPKTAKNPEEPTSKPASPKTYDEITDQ